MTATIRARLESPDGDPLADVPARAVLPGPAAGRPQIVATGRTDRDGVLAMDAPDLEAPDRPRLRLEVYLRRAYRVAATAPRTASGDVADYGALAVSEEPVATVGDEPVHGRPLDAAPHPVEPDAAADAPPLHDARTIDRLQARVAQLERENREAQTTIARLRTDLQGTSDSIRRLETKTAELVRERDEARGAEQELVSENSELRERLERTETELISTRERVDDLEAQLSEDEQAEIPISRVFHASGAQFDRVNRDLRDTGADYRLGAVEMELRVLVAGESSRIRLPSSSDLQTIDVGGLSTVKAEFQAVDAPTGRARERVEVADVTGSTRSMAERRLAGQGLRVRTLDEHVPAARAGSDHGRVLRQRPAAGAQAEPDSQVTIFVGRA